MKGFFMKTVFDLKLHERVFFADLEDLCKFPESLHSAWVLRVSSGWIYNFAGEKVFVPDVRDMEIKILQ
jgi:hypothetical protein